MAKLSAGGNYKIGAVTVRRGKSRYVFALRSDGNVLERLAGFYNENGLYTAHSTGYKIFGKIKPREGRGFFDRDDVQRLSGILEARNYEILETK